MYRLEGNRQKTTPKKKKQVTAAATETGAGLSSDLQPGQGQPVLTSLSRRKSDTLTQLCSLEEISHGCCQDKNQRNTKIHPWWVFLTTDSDMSEKKNSINICFSLTDVQGWVSFKK